MTATIHPYIDSVKHDALKKIRSSQQKKHRNADYVAVLDGIKELEWALERNAPIEMLLATDETKDLPPIVECEKQNASIFLTRESIFSRYFTSSSENAIAAIAKIHQAQLTPPKKLALFLENIIDPGNIGCIIRSARSFGIDHFFADSNELDWFSKKAIRASRGAHFSSSFHAFSNTSQGIDALKKAGYQIVATSPHAQSLISLAELKQKPAVLMVGNEQNGLTKTALENADVVARIPMMENIESLNVAVAAGISMYELYFRLVLTMLTDNIMTNVGRNIGVLFQLFPKVLNVDLAQVSSLNANQVIFLMIAKLDGSLDEQQAKTDLLRLSEDPEQTLDTLIKNGLLTKTNDAAPSYQITTDGEKTLAKLWMIVENAENKILSVLSDQEQAELRSMLTRLNHQCQNLLQAGKKS